jgi:Ni,Fe-hydrogenase maturation factor
LLRSEDSIGFVVIENLSSAHSIIVKGSCWLAVVGLLRSEDSIGFVVIENLSSAHSIIG